MIRTDSPGGDEYDPGLSQELALYTLETHLGHLKRPWLEAEQEGPQGPKSMKVHESLR